MSFSMHLFDEEADDGRGHSNHSLSDEDFVMPSRRNKRKRQIVLLDSDDESMRVETTSSRRVPVTRSASQRLYNDDSNCDSDSDDGSDSDDDDENDDGEDAEFDIDDDVGNIDDETSDESSAIEVDLLPIRRKRTRVNTNVASRSPPATARKSRGRPRKPMDSSSATAPAKAKMPGDLTYPVNDFSLTVAKTKADVPLVLLDVVHDFIVKYAIKGGVSTEVGHRAHNLHLQASFSMRFPKDRLRVKELTKLLRDELKAVVHNLSGYKIQLKGFAARQSFIAMLGYITKDEGMCIALCSCGNLECYSFVFVVRSASLSGSLSPSHSSRAGRRPPRTREHVGVLRRRQKSNLSKDVFQRSIQVPEAVFAAVCSSFGLCVALHDSVSSLCSDP